VLLYLCPAVVQWFDWGVMDRAWQMTVLVLLGAGVYAAVLLLTGLRLRHLRA
jgi:putative peptidoglycan lipid II flippase